MSSARDNIPRPRGVPVLGNILDIQDEVPIHGVERMLDLYGDIVNLSFFGRESIIIGSVELLDELCDEKRFWKAPPAAFDDSEKKSSKSDKPGETRGLFTSPSEDQMDWQQAHRTLMPAFGPLAIQEMFGEMHDIASQLVLKWARMGSSYRIPVTADFTRLTLDTIALCAMDYRFNSFYQEEMHPFVEAMSSTLSAASDRNKIGSILRKMMPWDRTGEKIKADSAYMRKVSEELVQHRRENPSDKHDLLNAMVNGKDPKTGEKMSDELIAANMVTFLIAGHETTSGLLSFAFLQLLTHPEAYFKVQQEVDRVIGRGRLRPEHTNKLKYIDAVLRETLRLTPTVPAFRRNIRRDNPNDFEPLLGGKYGIHRKDAVLCLISKCQRDPKVYGEDANEFKPERMLDDNFLRLPKNAWKPFGTGVRSCIGRAFAWQEAQMAMALLLQNFNFRLDDPSYKLKVKQTLTLKPDGFYMRATLREHVTATSLQNLLSAGAGDVSEVKTQTSRNDSCKQQDLKPVTILYGSNAGTCISLAQKLSVDARGRGYQADVMEMDAAVECLPRNRPVVIITSSYEGQPPDNAAHFTTWLGMTQDSNALEGVSYAVFGCGHSDWVTTYQRIPTLVDELLEERGAKRLLARGLTNAAEGNTFSDFETWSDNSLWPILAPSSKAQDAALGLEIEIATQNRTTYLRQDVQTGKVTKAMQLTADGELPIKRHLEIKLPEEMAYETGDYLAILPLNPPQNVERVLRHFKLAPDATITIKKDSATFLPTGVPLSVSGLLRAYVELALPLTKKDLQTCLAHSASPIDDETALSSLNLSSTSLLDLLELHPTVILPFPTFLSLLPPLRPRHYSISSSPLSNPKTCSTTYNIISSPSESGNANPYLGVTGNYLSTLRPGDEVSVAVRSTNRFFRLPADQTKTPILMFGAGTGIAPFRGFIQERAQLQASGRTLAPAILFFGCRSATQDRLYGQEMDEWVKAGVVDVRYALSREPEHDMAKGCQYIGDRMLRDQDAVVDLFKKGAKIYTCGSPGVVDNLGQAALKILQRAKQMKGEATLTEAEAREWFQERRNERFVVDVFA